MKILYISHPYTADDYNKVRRNVHNAARLAAKCVERGWAVINPIGNAHSMAKHVDRPHGDWLLMDLALMDRCDAVLFAKDWQNSRGCRVEHSYAVSKCFTVYYEEDGVPSPQDNDEPFNGTLIGEDARLFHEYIANPVDTPEGRDMMMRAERLAKKLVF